MRPSAGGESITNCGGPSNVDSARLRRRHDAAANVARGRQRTDLLFWRIQRRVDHHDERILCNAAQICGAASSGIPMFKAPSRGAQGGQNMTTIPAGESPDHSRLLQWMRDNGIPETRHSYIELAFGPSRPDPWTRDHEDTLPPHLRDVTKCQPDEQPGD